MSKTIALRDEDYEEISRLAQKHTRKITDQIHVILQQFKDVKK